MCALNEVKGMRLIMIGKVSANKDKIEKYGFIKGSYLGIKRILKCHPFGKSGYDL